MGNRPFGRSRVVHAFASIVLGMSAVAAYGGCSSSTPPDSAAPDGGADTSKPDTSVPIVDASDASVEDVSEDVAVEAAPPECDDAGEELPGTLACTGLYSDWAAKTVATSVRQYLPG